MSFVEKRNRTRPSSGEAPFGQRETFFSRTDKRGVIIGGNYVFKRVSNFEWDELVGAPHRVIRHPDMPKGVFWLLWDTIQSDQPIGAYVKNKAKDGLYYWVFAVVLPIEGGYLSVRMKPSSELFEVVKQEYTKLRRVELDTEITPKESAEKLLERIGELGFHDYPSFATHALAEELVSNDQKLGNSEDISIKNYREMMTTVSDLHEETKKLSWELVALSTIATNMRIIAARLEPSGGPVSALSENYWRISNEISSWFDSFISESGSAYNSIQTTIKEGLFLYCTARLMSNTAVQFKNERRDLDRTEADTELDHMNDLTNQYQKKSNDGLLSVVQEADNISTTVPTMKRYITGLTATRTMCKIENARLTGGGRDLDGIIEQLGEFQSTIEKQLDKIAFYIDRINYCASALT